MAKSKNNVVTFGLSGKIGDLLIFRRLNGQTIVSKMPEKSRSISEKQAQHRKRFQQAVIYAKNATGATETGELYKEAAKNKKGKYPMNVAIADFFNAPDIVNVNLSRYAGNIGDSIDIEAGDDFLVKSVSVEIIDMDGDTIEEGEAVHVSGLLWSYTATADNETTDGCRIVISASDLPGNITLEEVTL